MTIDYEVYDLGDVRLQGGATLRDCKLAYKTFGKLNADKSNAIVYPTWYSGQHYDNEWLVGKGMALDPDKYFIIIPNMSGNGLSTSPSNTPPPYNGPRFPKSPCTTTCGLSTALSPKSSASRRSSSSSAGRWVRGQTFEWGALYPDMIEFLVPFCGSAKCSRHNFVFLEGVKAALTADAAWNEGWYEKQPNKGLRAAARVYAGWGFSQAFYRARLDIESLGYSSLEDFLVAFWEGFFMPKDANNLLTMLWTWQNSDISANEIYNGDFKKALGAIKAKTYVMPGQTDLYFPPEDSENRSGQHAERQTHSDTLDMGALRRRPRHQSGRRQIPGSKAEGASCELAITRENVMAGLGEICRMDAVGIAKAVREKKLSPVEVVDASLAAMEQLEPKLHAFCTPTPDLARARAKELERDIASGKPLGPLAGVPIGIKDLVCTKGIATVSGSVAYRDFVPDEDDVVVERLVAAGAVILGKTNVPEFGYSGVGHNPVFETTRNPWNSGYDPGWIERRVRRGRGCRYVPVCDRQ